MPTAALRLTFPYEDPIALDDGGDDRIGHPVALRLREYSEPSEGESGAWTSRSPALQVADATASFHPKRPTRLTRGRVLWRACESVSAPVFAADAMMHSEQAVRVVAPLDIGEARVVRTPEGLLPVLLEIVALVEVGAGPGRRDA